MFRKFEGFTVNFVLKICANNGKEKKELFGELIVMLNGHVTILYMVSKLILQSNHSHKKLAVER